MTIEEKVKRAVDEIVLVCHGYLDCAVDNQNLRDRLAAVEAERDAAQKRVQALQDAIEEQNAAQAGEARLTEKADLLDWIDQKIGNVYEGIETVRLHRDDATNSFIVAIGKDSLAGYGPSLLDALRLARKDTK